MDTNLNVTSSFVTTTSGIMDIALNASASYETTAKELYKRGEDYSGAMIFIVVTLCVYSLGITAFVAGHIYRRSESKIEDMQISDYLSSVYTQKLDRIVRLERIRATSAACRQLLQDSEKLPENDVKVKALECDSVIDISFCENVSSQSGSVDDNNASPPKIDKNELTVRNMDV